MEITFTQTVEIDVAGSCASLFVAKRVADHVAALNMNAVTRVKRMREFAAVAAGTARPAGDLLAWILERQPAYASGQYVIAEARDVACQSWALPLDE